MATARPPGELAPEHAEGGPDLRVRPMTGDDVPAVLAIERESFTSPWSEGSFRTLLGRQDVTLLVAEEAAGGQEGSEGSRPAADGEAVSEGAPPAADSRRGHGPVVAYAVFWSVLEQGELANLAVRPDRRGRGIGRTLLDRVLELARLRGIQAVYLEVRASNEAALALYRSRGFQEMGVQEGYYKEPREDARVLRKELEE